MPKLVLFSDLDGTLLDAQTYSFEAAREALEVLHERDVPLVLVSSKTRLEIEPIRVRLKNRECSMTLPTPMLPVMYFNLLEEALAVTLPNSASQVTWIVAIIEGAPIQSGRPQ